MWEMIRCCCQKRASRGSQGMCKHLLMAGTPASTLPGGRAFRGASFRAGSGCSWTGALLS